MAARGVRVFPISAATGEGVGPLLDAVAQVLSGGALPTLGRAERPRRRPRTGTTGTRAAAAGSATPDPKNGRPPAKKGKGRPASPGAAGSRRGSSGARGGARKGSARSSRRPARKGTR